MKYSVSTTREGVTGLCRISKDKGTTRDMRWEGDNFKRSRLCFRYGTVEEKPSKGPFRGKEETCLERRERRR